MTSASSCSISRRVSLIAVSERVVAAAHADELERVVADGAAGEAVLRACWGSSAWPRRTATSAATAPAMFWLSNEPNAPLHSDMIAILIGVPEPPLRGCDGRLRIGRVGRRRGRRRARAGGAARTCSTSCCSLSSELPHPATTNASTAMVTREPERPPARTSCNSAYLCLLLETDTASTDRCGLGRPPLLRDVHRASSAARPAVARSHSPMRPLGETRTMTRKMTPISVWKRSATKSMSGA